MKTLAIGLVLTVATVGVLSAQTASQVQLPAGKTGILGVWSLNKDLSDSGDHMMGGEGRRGGGPGGGGMPPGGGMGGGGGRGGGMGGFGGGMGGFGGGGRERERESEQQRNPAWVRAAMQAANGMTIVPADDAVNITSSDGVNRKYVATGKKAELLTGDGVVGYRAKWDGDVFSVEAEIEKSPRVTWTYIPMDSGRQLLVVIKVSGGGMPRDEVLHHVYNREKGL
jgi:hypothetical protein